MRSHLRFKWFAALLTVLAPSWAAALDLDYYTYNGFEETVDAFQRVALIFHDDGFLVFVGMFAVVGVLVGGFMTAANGLRGQQVNPIGFLIPVAFGLALFRGLVMPSGTIFVYDPVRNATQAVPDVPDLIVLLAGGLNKIERGIIEIVDTNPANLYINDAGSVDYSLVLNAWNTKSVDVSLERSLVNYYTDCGVASMALGTNGASTQELMRESQDLYFTFAAFNSRALSTVWYPNASDQSVAGTCFEAWNHLGPILNNINTFEEVLNATCTQTGFLVTSPPQRIRCLDQVARAAELYGVVAATQLQFMRSIMLARAVSDALNKDDFKLQQRKLVDRQIMTESLGAAEAMNRWVPKLRAFLVATVLGVMPLALLFAVTPLIGRALALVAGLFLWLTLWGITDAISVQMVRDTALAAFEQIQRFHLSFEGLMLTPEAATQALGVFGKARTMALMVATMLSYSLFKFGGYAFTSIAESWQRHIDQAGETAAKQSLMPEARSALMQQLQNSVGPQAAVANNGFDNTAFAAAAPMMGAAAKASYISEQLQGHTPPRAYTQPTVRRYSGAPTDAASPSTDTPAVGADGLQEVTVAASRPIAPPAREPRSNYDLVLNTAQREAGADLGMARGFVQAANNEGKTILDTAADISEYKTVYDTVSTAGRREQHRRMPGGVVGAAEFDGQMAAARTRAFAIVYDNVNRDIEGEEPGTITAAGMYRMAKQLEGAAIGLSEAGKPEEYIRSVREPQKIAMAYARELEGRGGTDKIGSARAQQEIIRSEGFFEALKHTNANWMTKGAALQEIQSAARAEAVFQLPQPGPAIRDAEETALAAQLGRDHIARQLANLLEVGSNTMQGLIESEETQQGAHRSVALAGERAERMLKKLSAMGLFNPKEIEFVRQRGGFGLSFDIVGGKAVTAKIVAGNTAIVSNTFEMSEGRSVVRFDTDRSDYTHTTLGDLAVRDHLDTELLRAYGGNIASAPIEKTFWPLAQNVGGFLRARSITLQANDGENISNTASVSGSLTVQGQGKIGTPLEDIAGSGASAGATLGVTGSVGRSRNDFRSTTTQTELNTRLGADIIREERVGVIAEYERVHGVGSAATANQAELSQQWAARVIERADAVYQTADKRLEKPSDENDSISDAPRPRRGR